MSKNRTLLLSVLAGLVAVLLVRSYISSKEEELLRLSVPVKVLVAARDIAEGTRLQDGMLETIEVPKKFLQPDVITDLDEVRDRIVAMPLLRGTQVLGSMLALSQNIGLAQKIPQGKQAMTVHVDGASSHSGLLQPGDVVDVAVTVEVLAEGDSSQSGGIEDANIYAEETEVMTKTILTNVMVLAVGQRSYRSRTAQYASNTETTGNQFFATGGRPGSANSRANTTTISLALDSKQVLALTLAQEIGVIALSLHSSWESPLVEQDIEKDAKGQKIGTYELLGIRRPVVKNSVDVLYGARRK